MKFAACVFLVTLTAVTAHSECKYSFDPAQTHIAWTAYKTTAKLAVSGEFKVFSFHGPQSGADLPSILSGLTIDVALDSSTTGNTVRDANLLDGFFKFVLGFNARGSIFHVLPADDATGERGSLLLSLQLNSRAVPVPMTYGVDSSGQFQARGSVTFPDLMLLDSLSKLDQICHDFHTGSDGVAKVWPGIDITVTAPEKKICN